MARARRRTFMVVLAAACGAGIGGAVLVAADTPPGIQGCVNNFGSLRVTSDPTGFHNNSAACQPGFEHPVTINAVGPPGPPGPAGPAGVPGSGGSSGPNGKDAPTGTSTSTSPGPPANFIAAAAFPMATQHFVRAEVDCPKGRLATGGSSAVVSPLGESPAIESPSSGTGSTGAPGHPAIGWLAEASNTTAQAASLRISVICTGQAATNPPVVARLILSRPLHSSKVKAKAKKP